MRHLVHSEEVGEVDLEPVEPWRHTDSCLKRRMPGSDERRMLVTDSSHVRRTYLAKRRAYNLIRDGS